MTVQSALRFCQYHGIANIVVVAQSATGHYKAVRAVAAAATRRPRR
jgi:hypothetical protein